MLCQLHLNKAGWKKNKICELLPALVMNMMGNLPAKYVSLVPVSEWICKSKAWYHLFITGPNLLLFQRSVLSFKYHEMTEYLWIVGRTDRVCLWKSQISRVTSRTSPPTSPRLPSFCSPNTWKHMHFRAFTSIALFDRSRLPLHGQTTASFLSFGSQLKPGLLSEDLEVCPFETTLFSPRH